MNAKKLPEQLIAQFRSMTGTYLDRYPVSKIEFDRAYVVNFKTFLKAIVGISYLLFYSIDGRGRKYYFQGLRNSAILSLFQKTDIVIIGGVEEKSSAKSKGYGFLWSGGLVSAILLASKKNIYWPLRMQVGLFLRKFSKSDSWFLLIEDTLPVGSSFALLGNEMKRPTILLQHGFITGTEIMIDGKRCKYALLYHKVLATFVNADRGYAYELGPAFDAKPDQSLADEIILVGTGGKGYDPGQYFKALDLYSEIEALLKRKWKVSYRPHPNEDPADYSSLFDRTDRRSAIECLSGGRKVFIGFVSTLLYEARYFGHGVVAVKDPAEPSLLYLPDAEISYESIETLDSVIPVIFDRICKNDPVDVQPLAQRFGSILAEIENERKWLL